MNPGTAVRSTVLVTSTSSSPVPASSVGAAQPASTSARMAAAARIPDLMRSACRPAPLAGHPAFGAVDNAVRSALHPVRLPHMKNALCPLGREDRGDVPGWVLITLMTAA